MAAKKKKAITRSKSAPLKEGAAHRRAAPKAIQQALSQKTSPHKTSPQRPSLSNALAEAVWTDADEALAEALLELDHVHSAADSSEREAALSLLAQALARAARKRGLTRLGVLNARVPFDADEHELDMIGKKPKTVRILARGVARGAEVLRRPRVRPMTRRAKSAGGKKKTAGKR